MQNPQKHVRVITVACHVPVPDRAAFTAADLAARLDGLGEHSAAATARRIARGELRDLDLGEHGTAYGLQGHAGTSLPGPLASLADACQRQAAELGLGRVHQRGLDPEDITVTVGSCPPDWAPASSTAPGTPQAAPSAPDPATSLELLAPWPARRRPQPPQAPRDHGGPPHRHDSDGEPCL